jgi:hypothetical protein
MKPCRVAWRQRWGIRWVCSSWSYLDTTVGKYIVELISFGNAFSNALSIRIQVWVRKAILIRELGSRCRGSVAIYYYISININISCKYNILTFNKLISCSLCSSVINWLIRADSAVMPRLLTHSIEVYTFFNLVISSNSSYLWPSTLCLLNWWKYLEFS